MPGTQGNLHPIDSTYSAVCSEYEAIAGTVGLWDVCWFICGDSWRSTPIHEAGHAVMAKHFRAPLYGASIYDLGSPERCVAEGAVHFSAPRPNWHRLYGERVAAVAKTQLPDTNEIGVAMVLIYQAGLLAELMATGKPPGPNDLVCDRRSSDFRLAVHYAGAKASTEMLLACQRVAARILDSHWSELVVIASALEERGFLTGAEISGVLAQPSAIN